MALRVGNLSPEDSALLARIVPLNDEMRGTVCGMARIGVAFRHETPERASAWIELLEPHPFYKAGQVMFDLLEFEDFMLDGEVPTVFPAAIRDLAGKLLASLALDPPAIELSDDLPALEPGFYLYRDVVLGLVRIALTAVPRV